MAHYIYGVPLCGNPIKIAFWEPDLFKMSKKLTSWKKAFMSRGRRLTLISAVLNVLPMYFMSIFRVPRRIAEIMEKAMKRCFVEEEPLHLSKKVIRSKWSKYGL